MMGDFGTISTLPQGFLLGGRYEIQRVIGQGNMGVVYLATDKQLNDSPVAVNNLKLELLHSAEATEQLKREVISSIRLTHSNIVRVISYEEWQGAAYIVMEYIEGKTLKELLAAKKKLDVEEFLEIARQMCDALQYAHAEGVMHQDIEPANIFINNKGIVKLADFGFARIAKYMIMRSNGKTPSGNINYMSPELLLGMKPSIASDIYSLGITFYEMLSGDPPFLRGDIFMKHQEETPLLLMGIPGYINRAILIALEKDPDLRHPSAGEFWNLLYAGKKRAGTELENKQKQQKMPETERSIMTGEVEDGNPDELLTYFTNYFGMEFRLIYPGSFMMGAGPGDNDARSNEKPQRLVEITRPFYIGIFEVTQAQYESVIGNNPSYFKDLNRPVERMGWRDAKRFCEELSQMTGEGYRLPTEAEWEYACRAGTKTKYYWGEAMDDRYVWYNGNSRGETHPVGHKLPNAWGLYDMIGNVWDWCEDWYQKKYYRNAPSLDPTGPTKGLLRVVRGGCFENFEWDMRSSTRSWNTSGGSILIGFRVVREIV